MKLSDWHQRFVLQASWTAQMRRFIHTHLVIPPQSKVLELGCGTGAVLCDPLYDGLVRFGIDTDLDRLHFFHKESNEIHLTAADAATLPFASGSFDLVFCHYFLLWLTEPLLAIAEVKRVLKSGGYFAIYAEPDYLGRIDTTPQMNHLAEQQNRSLKKQGVCLTAGRDMVNHMQNAGFGQVQAGIYAYHWQAKQEKDIASESEVLRYDLDQLNLDKTEMESLIELLRRSPGFSYIPTFYAWALKQ
jgi:ubiquinone/menaquinone biosynthesis C-methylase UbiE